MRILSFVSKTILGAASIIGNTIHLIATNPLAKLGAELVGCGAVCLFLSPRMQIDISEPIDVDDVIIEPVDYEVIDEILVPDSYEVL